MVILLDPTHSTLLARGVHEINIYRVGKVLFIYLVLPIGGDPRRLGFLEPVSVRIRNRLADMHSLGWEEEMLRECKTLLLPVTLQVDSPDRWQWRPDPSTGYYVCDAYQILTLKTQLL
jgi:hypothetical protein